MRALSELAAFEYALGDPTDRGGAFSFARCAELDRAEEFPAAICRLLDELGLPRQYVPAEFGGGLASYEQAMQRIRLVARRDLTVAIAHGKTYLGSVPVWVGGSAAQACRLGADVLGGAVVSLGLTEPEHGSDLLASDVTATPAGAGWLVDGEKWLINNATRGDLLAVLARTADGAGPRALSLLLVDKRRLPAGSFQHSPAVRTHGIRGADISGITFTAAPVPAGAVIGPVGTGVETTLKALQLTRTMCAALSLGAADHALRLGLRFALEHRLYDRGLIDLPHARRILAEAYTDLLVAEALSLVAARSVHTLTGELSVTSALVKYFVPATVEELVGRLGQLLGARAFFTGTYADGMFQKVERDHRVVGIFDGNTLVNLNALINQFGRLVRGYRDGSADQAGLAAAATFAAPLPAFDRDALTLLARRGSSLVQSLPACVDELQALAGAGVVPAELAGHAKQIREAVDDLHARLAAHRPSRDVPAAAFTLAKRYTWAAAAAACTQLWLRNRAGRTGELWAGGLWLDAALRRTLRRFQPALPDTDDAVFDRLAGCLRQQYAAGQLFSVQPFPLAEASGPAEASR